MRKNPLRSLLFFTAAAAALAGCSHGAGISSALPVHRVVIYRNGVGYFERGGQVRDDQVQFQVRPSHIDDFLATLSVMEAGGSSVQSASFPLRVDAPPSGEKPADASQALDTVTLHLDGKAHDLTVGYVAEQPIWRPSYRLVLENHQLSLQAWGIVQNVSGEDWNQVQLSLVAGAPIAFQSTLSRPVTPARPVVSDQGELISAVPQSESSLAQLEPGAPPPPVPAPAAAAPPAPMMDELREDDYASGAGAAKALNAPRPSRAMKKEMSRSSVGGALAGRPMGSAIPSERSRALLASTAVTAGTTRYDLPMPVTVPDQSATLVLLSALSVPGESVHMFAPDPGVPDSSRHPFRVARFKNITAGLLERGPIAVVESGAFLGQGVLEPLSAGSEATVPFALDRGVAVDTESNLRLVGARVSQIEAGNLTIERDRVWETTYRVRNGEAEAVKVVVRHPRHAGTRLEKPPAGTEDQVGKNTALAPVQVKARETAELHLEEHEPVAQAADWMSDEANEAMQELFLDRSADAAVVGVLKDAWTTRESLRKHQEENEKVSTEKEILHQAAEESRENLRALQRNPAKGVSELRDKLAQRLLGMDNRLAELSKRQVELQLKIGEESVRFREAVRDLKLVRPSTRGTKA